MRVVALYSVYPYADEELLFGRSLIVVDTDQSRDEDAREMEDSANMVFTLDKVYVVDIVTQQTGLGQLDLNLT